MKMIDPKDVINDQTLAVMLGRGYDHRLAERSLTIAFRHIKDTIGRAPLQVQRARYIRAGVRAALYKITHDTYHAGGELTVEAEAASLLAGAQRQGA